MENGLTATASRVAWAMKKRGLTQRSLSLAANLSQSMVGQIVRGDVKNSSADTLQKLARAMNVSTGWLITGNGMWEPYEGDEPASTATAPSPPPTVPERYVERDPRYHAIEAAIAYHPGRWSDEVIAAGRSLALKADELAPQQAAAMLDGLAKRLEGFTLGETDVTDEDAGVGRRELARRARERGKE